MNKYFKGLMIEPTNICNLRCPICITGNGLNGAPKGTMKFSHFKVIIDQVKNFLENILLWGWGEPFLAPDIMKMIDYADKNDILTTIHTNGTVLNKKMMGQFKKNYRLNISFSIDGITQKSYAYYRKGGNLKKVFKNLSYLVNLKEKYNLFNLRIIWQFLIMKTNEHAILKAQKLAESIGVDKFLLKTIGIAKTHHRYDDFIPANKKLRRERRGEKKQTNQNCSFIKPGRPVVSWQGDIYPCCQDFWGEYKMGNAFEDKLLDIWNSKKYADFRENYIKGVNALCNNQCHLDKKNIYINY